MAADTNYAAIQDAVEKDLAQLGLYLTDARWIAPGDDRPKEAVDMVLDDTERESRVAFLVMDLAIGDVAFTSRVLDPEQADWDKEFRLMAAGLKIDAEKDLRAQIEDDIRRGQQSKEG